MGAVEGPLAGADDAPPDYVVLRGGERVSCEVVEAGLRTVQVRIGARLYRFERASLKEVHAAGVQALDPATLAFVHELSLRLVHTDPRLRRAAEAGLRALGAYAAPYVAAVANEAEDTERQAALRHIDLSAGGAGAKDWRGRTARFIERQVVWARENIHLQSTQEAGFRKALATFFQGLRPGSDRSKAVEAFYRELGTVLSDTQVKGIRTAWRALSNR